MDLELVHDGVPVTILHGPYIVDGSPTPEAIAFFTSLIARLDEIRRYAARKKLLRLYNESWLDENQKAIDENNFVANLTKPSILLFDETGAATVYFHDGDMFGGHAVEVSVNKGEFFHVGIIG